MNEITNIITIRPSLSGLSTHIDLSSVEFTFIDDEIDFILFIGMFKNPNNITHSKISYFMGLYEYR
jgi:hypothetical protein